MFGAIAAGMAAALAFYLSTFFWGFTPLQIGLQTIAIFLSAVIGAALAPVVTRTLGKKHGAMIVGLIAFVGAPLPIVLRLADLLPEGPTPFVFWFVLVTGTIDVGLIICFQILAASMMSDLVEQAELKTGRRSEGIFFAASTFINKMVAGLGVMAATFVLTLAQFPAGADPSQVPPDAIWRLGAYYVPSILVLWLSMMAAISTYRLDRAGHEENLRRLAERKRES
jgi:Na+/melibiose symporter-like transporter